LKPGFANDIRVDSWQARSAMSGPDVMFPEEQQQMSLVCARLARDANAKAVLLIGRDGQPIAEAGDTEELDVTSLSSLTAGNVAATGGISKILREKDFSSQFHEGEKTNIHITLVGGRAILLVLFDERSSLGLVRLRVRKSSDEMVRLFDQVAKKAASKSQPSILTEITDSDIDNLFND
jgi:predicted regulator of Ras-like GTPase activity (Roadblock/LC7/MglB family)